jgi:lysine-specific histone demethylase 1
MPAGHAAEQLERADNAATLQHVMGLLKAVFPGRRLPAPVGVAITRWGQDPFSRGAYSFIPVGFREETMVDIQRAVGPLVWAGEYATISYLGTTHGAAVTGSQCAAELMSMLHLGRARLASSEAAAGVTSPLSKL